MTPLGFRDRRRRARPARGIADADGGGDGLRIGTGWPSTIGAAPAAWKPHMRGSEVVMPAAAGIRGSRASRP